VLLREFFPCFAPKVRPIFSQGMMVGGALVGPSGWSY
jgi:hypothetical protein